MAARVSIGLPVYNGEAYLREAIESLLAQTYEDFELIICDNASTDGTEQICREYAARDARVRYYRNERNLGAARNFNRTFELATSEYHKWAAYDDVCAPDFLAACVDALDRNRSAVLSFTSARTIDDEGRDVGPRDYVARTDLPTPHERLAELLSYPLGSPPIYGLIRSDVLKKTALHGAFVASDLVLLAELALYGPFEHVRRPLLMHREHRRRAAYVNRSAGALSAWYDPGRSGAIVLPFWRLFYEYCRAIRRSPLRGRERWLCYRYVLRWWRWSRPTMARELLQAGSLLVRQARARALPK